MFFTTFIGKNTVLINAPKSAPLTKSAAIFLYLLSVSGNFSRIVSLPRKKRMLDGPFRIKIALRPR